MAAHSHQEGASQESALIRRHRKSQWPAISYDDALHIVDEFFENSGKTKLIPIQKAREGLVLAEDIVATRPVPEFLTSTRDGYAVVASDGAGLRKVITKTTAGTITALTLHQGSCCRVNTGSMVPEGADTVVQVEDTKIAKHNNVEELVIEILTAPKEGENIRPVGCDVAVGDVLLKKNTLLGPAELGILALSERKLVSVYCRPRIAVMSTGNELVDYCTNDYPIGLIRDTNRPQLLSLFRYHGFKPVDMGIAPDSEEKLIECLGNAFSVADVIITSGGVSMGEKDLLKNVLQENFNFTIHFGRVLLKPGLPTTFASGLFNNEKKAVFALPGNPVSSYVTACLFALPAVRKLSGIEHYHLTTLKSKLSTDIKLEARPEFRPAKLRFKSDGSYEVDTTGESQLSSRLLAACHSNVFLKLPPRSESITKINKGELVDVLIVGAL